jgi:hypothetical protein
MTLHFLPRSRSLVRLLLQTLSLWLLYFTGWRIDMLLEAGG